MKSPVTHLSNKQLAQKLGLSEQTVKNQATNFYKDIALTGKVKTSQHKPVKGKGWLKE